MGSDAAPASPIACHSAGVSRLAASGSSAPLLQVEVFAQHRVQPLQPCGELMTVSHVGVLGPGDADLLDAVQGGVDVVVLGLRALDVGERRRRRPLDQRGPEQPVLADEDGARLTST